MTANKNSGASRKADSGRKGTAEKAADGLRPLANEESEQAAQKDSTVAAGYSESGVTGLYGSEGVETEENKRGGKSGNEYTVKDGDSLESIASENDTTPAELVKLNPELAGGYNHVYTGRTIRLK